MRIEDSIIIDEKLFNLNKEQKQQYEIFKKINFKSTEKLLMSGIFFYFIGVPFFYMGFKNIKIREYLTLILIYVLIYPLSILIVAFLAGGLVGVMFSFILLLALIGLFICNFIFKVLFLLDVEQRVNDYNYACKEEFLGRIERKQKMEANRNERI